MNINSVIYYYELLTAFYIMFIFISLFYLFNRKVLSKLNISLKITVYITLLTIVLMGVEFLIVDYFNFSYLNQNNQYWFLLICLLVYLILIFLVLYLNLYPIKRLKNGMKKLLNNKHNDIVVLGSSEFDNIQTSLEQLENKLNLKDEYVLKLKKEYYKFVPKEFYTHLNKNDVFELKLGENVQKDVTVLFIDVRHSYKTSETLSLEENFKFINSYLSVVGECVRLNKGFIDKFLGDGVLAVFLSETDAIKCSNDISNKIENINLVSVGGDKIKYGIGIHCER